MLMPSRPGRGVDKNRRGRGFWGCRRCRRCAFSCSSSRCRCLYWCRRRRQRFGGDRRGLGQWLRVCGALRWLRQCDRRRAGERSRLSFRNAGSGRWSNDDQSDIGNPCTSLLSQRETRRSQAWCVELDYEKQDVDGQRDRDRVGQANTVLPAFADLSLCLPAFATIDRAGSTLCVRLRPTAAGRPSAYKRPMAIVLRVHSLAALACCRSSTSHGSAGDIECPGRPT